MMCNIKQEKLPNNHLILSQKLTTATRHMSLLQRISSIYLLDYKDNSKSSLDEEKIPENGLLNVVAV